ncbi:MAG TPA: hypothetical protein VLM05_13765 [Mycobacteriales bacterium]|nr:hypothetical protein [Mycobacteriales bacterium]
MRKNVRRVIGSGLAAGAIGAVLLPAAAASATEGFACPTGTDTIEIPYSWSADNVPSLAGTVCVEGGTTLLNSYDVNAPWKATVKSVGASSKGLSVVFKNTQTKQKITLVYARGRTVIK